MELTPEQREALGVAIVDAGFPGRSADAWERADRIGTALAPLITTWLAEARAASRAEVVERVEAVRQSWRADEHDAAACQDFGCKDCVMVACDFDIRAALTAEADR